MSKAGGAGPSTSAAPAAGGGSSPVTLSINGFPVVFPFKPYGQQCGFMAKVLQTLDTQGNALLEAPTGFGKTLSLLCSALAWQKKRKEMLQAAATQQAADPIGDGDDDDSCCKPGKAPASEAPSAPPPVSKIYYATRTHSQIGQVVQELKRTGYNPTMAILASRPHYCINPSAIKSKDGIDAECERLRKEEHGCSYMHGMKKNPVPAQRVHDIEDLVALGKRRKACPYFTARELAKTADLVFCPYSYLTDPLVREAMGVDVSDAVVIFDEAHNIEDVAREAGSCDLEARADGLLVTDRRV